jgi:predicted choloylglycine hydrolase
MNRCERLAGNAYEIGLTHGQVFKRNIAANVKLTLEDWLPAWNPGRTEAARAWALSQRERHFARWPWLAEEIRGIADGSSIPCETIELLNFRAWQFFLYGAGGACTSFIGRSADAGLVLGGALDDPRELYGMVDVAPRNGFRFMTFSLLGTTWASRGVNAAGLAIGISSLPLTGLRHVETMWQQDFCLRVMLQTCADCAAVEAFCREHVFSLNVMAVDAGGNRLALSRTGLGCYIHGPEMSVLANHLPTPALEALHRAAGWDGVVGAPTSTCRAEQMAGFLQRREGAFSLLEAQAELARRDMANDACVNNAQTCFLTLAAPASLPGQWQVAERPAMAGSFETFKMA